MEQDRVEEFLKNYDSSKKIVSLYDMEGVLLIWLCQSGVLYTNQVGGNYCLQPVEEGILIPFNTDSFPEDPKTSLWMDLHSLFVNSHADLTPERANIIDLLLADYMCTRCAKVDRKRLKDSFESWVYVDIEENEDSEFHNFGKGKGVLTWPNSD